MRGNSKTFRILLFFSLFLAVPFKPVSAHIEYGAVPLSRDDHGVDALSAVATTPDGEIPFEKTLVTASFVLGRELTGASADPVRVEREIDRLAGRVRSALRERRDPREIVSTLNRVLYEEEGFTYDCVAGNPDNYLLDRVLERKRGNCLGMTVLYLILAERLSLPLHGVYVPSHCFVRYEDGGVRINIETGEKGADRGDGMYRRDFDLSAGRPYLESLGKREMIGVYLKSLGAAFSRKGREERALRLYREAVAFFPGLPDAYFNAGVSYQKTGRLDDAVAQYRRSLLLDPGLAVARDNLGVALAGKGLFSEALAEARTAAALSPRNPVTLGNLAATLCACGMIEDGIREYRKVLELDPDNVRALAGLAKAHYARGEFREAVEHFDKARDRGCDFDPVMLGTLERHRDPSPASQP